jgi:hypothetical protein
MTQNQLDEFLNDYKQLLIKHNVDIGACGCCESPWVTAATKKNIDDAIEHLRSISPVEG